jgi:putative membrane protein insertion efficiency factor
VDSRPRPGTSSPPGAGDSRRALVVALPIFLIRCYQAMVRPLLIGSCKFVPTCSEYAIEALQHHGLLGGTLLGLRRIIRCHPFSPGGIDLVPPPPGVRAHRTDDSAHIPPRDVR